MEVSTSAYYSWTKQPETTEKILETQRLEAKVRELFMEPTVLANDSRPISEISQLQGLPDDFDIPAFTRGALVRAIGNGVHYGMAKALANAVKHRQTSVTLCACSCGRPVTGKQIYANGACRKRAFDRRVTGQAI